MILTWINFNILLSCIFGMLTLMLILGSSLFFIITNPQKAIHFYPTLY